jgi:2,3-dihydroxybiphenyl 1,2-dioxygenase
MASVSRLGYWGFEVSDLAAWERFATNVLGLAVEPTEGAGLRLRMDEYAWRIALEPGPADDLAYAGWEVKDARTLGALGEQLARGGVAVEEGKPERCAARQVQGLLTCTDPAGIPTELYWGPRLADTRFSSPRVVSGFVTGDQGVGHMVIASPDVDASRHFYTELLGLRLSDTIHADLGPMQLHITFLHANARHHSVAFSGLPMPKHIHHFMIEAREFGEVGAARDRALDAGVTVTMDLGRHPNDKMFSFYSKTPSGFEVEFGWGGLAVDDATWRPVSYSRISEWGHRRPGA